MASLFNRTFSRKCLPILNFERKMHHPPAIVRVQTSVAELTPGNNPFIKLLNSLQGRDWPEDVMQLVTNSSIVVFIWVPRKQVLNSNLDIEVLLRRASRRYICKEARKADLGRKGTMWVQL